MNSERHKRIERRAYAFWEAEGQPHGKHEEHWQLAARQIEAEESAPTSEKRKKRRSSSRGAEIPASKKSKK
jgi:sirohydrochlorin ferrochelatase